MKVAPIQLIATLTLLTGVASADETQKTYEERGKGDDRHVIFDDDLALGSGLSANDPTIRVRPFAPRRSLLSLRTNFVQELLSSVENL